MHSTILDKYYLVQSQRYVNCCHNLLSEPLHHHKRKALTAAIHQFPYFPNLNPRKLLNTSSTFVDLPVQTVSVTNIYKM